YTPSMRDTLVIDLETKKSFDEVGGEKNIADLGISVAGVYSYAKDAFFALEEHELPRLSEMLKEADHVVGFNIIHFDIPVMRPYVDAAVLDRIAVTDIFADAVAFLGHRVGLGGVAKATLGQSKSGHGLEALEWFRQGRVDEVKKYCLDDVRLTRDLYEYGKKNGHLLFESFIDHKIHSIPVAWEAPIAEPVGALVARAFAERKQLAIEYISSQDSDGAGFRKSRLIEVRQIKPNGEIEAYCHLRRDVRNFRVSRIAKAELTDESYRAPRDLQAALF
ncbi:MAG: WYL domain-containing protein, partial [Patescibacteria group bacterium]